MSAADEETNGGGAVSAEDKESLARAQLPYRAEYCKSGRAKCKKCAEPMDNGSLKLANMVKSRFHDGYDANFYHVTCFFRIKRPTSVAEIRHFETLKFEDQKMLEKAVETNGLSVLGSNVVVETSAKGKGKTKQPKAEVKKEQEDGNDKKSKAKKRSTTERDLAGSPTGPLGIMVNYDDFLVEYAKSNRSKCVKCEGFIEKDSVRLGKFDYNAAETTFIAGPVPRYYHVDCFAKSLDKLEFYGKVEKIKDFGELEKEDRKMLRKKIKSIEPPTLPASDPGEKKIKKEDLKEEQMLKKQSDRLFALRHIVNGMKRKDLERLLEHMKQKSNFKNTSGLVDMATDVLAFGALEKCPKCKKRRGMMLRGSSYICSVDADATCDFETHDPNRDVPDIPDEIIDKYPYFADVYEFIPGKRLFSSKFLKAVEQKEAEDNKMALKGAPLEGIHLGVISYKGVEVERSRLEKKVITLGGRLHTALDSSLFVILTTEDELARNNPKVEVAKELNVPFARADFLFKIENKEDVVKELEKCLIGDYSTEDLNQRFNRMSQSDVVNVKQERN